MTRRIIHAAVSLGLLLGAAAPAAAIPAFARRYEVGCHFCHEGFPKLNVMGQRFKERGFRLEREEDFDARRWARSLPLHVRASGARLFRENDADGTLAVFKPVSAGNVGERLSYWADWVLLIRSEALRPVGEDAVDARGISNAWARLEILEDFRLYVRAGRMELDVPFTNLRTPNLSAYDVFSTTTGFESDTIADYQDGLELGGELPGEVRWSAAVVKGRDAGFVRDLDLDEPGRFEANVFLRLAKRVGRDRFGLFSYIGRNHLAVGGISTDPGWKDTLFRIGADGNVWLQRVNVYGALMYGRNANSIATVDEPQGTRDPRSFTGGFVQADIHPRDEVAFTARIDVVRRPITVTGAESATFTTLTPGVRLFPRERFRVAFEYSFPDHDRPGRGTLQADIAF
jgi:hypothetical protein